MANRYLTASITLVVGIVVWAIKYWAYSVTGSQAVFSDAVESIINVITAVTLLITVIYASKPADDDHPYGHGKAEYFSAAFEGGLIFFAGVAILLGALKSFFEPHALSEIDKGQVIIVLAALINLALGAYLVYVGRKQKNLAFEASGRHLLSDFWTSAAVLAALALVKWTSLIWFDPLMAFGAALYLLWNGVSIVIRSTNELMDANDDKILSEVLAIFKKNLHKGIIRIHHTRVMRSGPYHHIDSHVVVPEFWDVQTSHDQTEGFSKKFFKEYSHEGEIHFHVDPCRRAYCRVCEYEPCPVRREPFKGAIPLTLEELKSPLEPDEYLQSRQSDPSES
jgi:cation diffusion facilitator family transporter